MEGYGLQRKRESLQKDPLQAPRRSVRNKMGPMMIYDQSLTVNSGEKRSIPSNPCENQRKITTEMW